MSVSSIIEYRPWPRDERYLACSDGSIIGARGWMLKPGLSRGYLIIVVLRKGKRYNIKVHTVIAEAFHGLRPKGFQCAHENGDNLDNHAENLSWKTAAQNAADKIRHGTHVQGARISWSKLTESDVRNIRIEYATGTVSQRNLAKRYKVHQATIHDIVTRRTWRHVVE